MLQTFYSIIIIFCISFVPPLKGQSVGTDFRWNNFKVAKHDHWLTVDKYYHIDGTRWIAQELAYHYHMKNKYKIGAYTLLISSFNEIKDGYFDYRTYGFWGGEGFSFKDMGAHFVGVGFYLAGFNTFETAGLIIGSSLLNNYIRFNKFLPHGVRFQKNTRKDDRPIYFPLNAQTSMVLPLVINSDLRKTHSLLSRSVISLAAVIVYEGMNGFFKEKDIPFFGSRDGARLSDIYLGGASIGVTALYEFIFFREYIGGGGQKNNFKSKHQVQVATTVGFNSINIKIKF